MDMTGMKDAQKKKGEMRFEFQVTLPAAVTEANGPRDGKTSLGCGTRQVQRRR